MNQTQRYYEIADGLRHESWIATLEASIATAHLLATAAAQVRLDLIQLKTATEAEERYPGCLRPAELVRARYEVIDQSTDNLSSLLIMLGVEN